MKSSEHIEKVIHKQPKDQILKNLRLKATIESVQWLTFQACAFRGHDESIDSMNRGNFIELIKYTAQWNDKVAEVVLENAPRNAKYTAQSIQKQVLADKIVRVEDTSLLTLKKEISQVLMNYDLQIDKMRGQGYDGASNMLQLALVAQLKDVAPILLLFSTLNSIINLITAFPKRHVVETLIKDGASNSIRGEANVRSTKDALHKLRLEGWDTFFEEVESFCKKHDIDIPDMNAPYKVEGQLGHSCPTSVRCRTRTGSGSDSKAEFGSGLVKYLADSLIVYIEKELSVNIDSDSIIKDFDTLKERRVQLH
ncbi:hypothetical protein L3X38_011190 [Prunus dulcis]|uniref:DUF4371 domain-containing protein n=1 Tax=Prunus dulcis TaxID=3755 RepID=A0AAD4ZEX2_PRUDU|nr:hypothetical protein L3X38_011190 [Prunus dulcis]